MQRKAEKVTTNRKEREGTKARDILKKYPKEKAESLMANLKKKGLWYYDPDFEGDEEDCLNWWVGSLQAIKEIYYYTNSGNKLRNDDVTTEGASVNIRDKGNKELAEALIDPEGGMLASGIQPEVQAATEEGQKNLLEALNSAQVQKAKKAKTEKTEKTEKAEPKTLDELAAAKMEECLKKGAEGRKFAIALESLEYSGDLAKQLFTFSTKMEQVFKRLQELRTKKETDPNLYEKHFTIIEEKLTWYAKAESAAKALQNGLGKPKKGKATKKKEKDDKDEKAGAGWRSNGRHRARQKPFDQLRRSETAETYIRMIGSGRANVSEVCDLARANLADGLPFEALKAFGSLGAGGRHCSNQERDLHKWLHSLFGLKLTTYKVKMFLNVPSEEKPVGVDVPFLLPHEVIHALSNAGQLQFARSMTGHRSRASIVKFWQHCVGLEEWAHHPSLQNPETYDCMLPLALHVDGAEFYSNSEYLCWSMCSVLSSEHVFDSKFPVVVLPHSSMLDERVKAHVHATVSRVLAWSLRCASSGVAPSTGVFDEPLLGERATLAGQPF
eukprot:s1968_g30.t2